MMPRVAQGSVSHRFISCEKRRAVGGRGEGERAKCVRRRACTMAERRKEIYKYEAKHNVFGLAWSNHKEHAHRLAIGSFVEDYTKCEAFLLCSETLTACQCRDRGRVD